MNVFVSRPTILSTRLEKAYDEFHKRLEDDGFRVRRLGGGDHSRKPPLRAVIDLINQCCGTVVLGYPQTEFHHHARRNSNVQNEFSCVYPTPWNQIEGALAYGCGCPVLVVAHPGISGGVFDHGITGEGVVHIDLSESRWPEKAEFSQPYEEWLRDVKSHLSRSGKKATQVTKRTAKNSRHA